VVNINNGKIALKKKIFGEREKRYRREVSLVEVE